MQRLNDLERRMMKLPRRVLAGVSGGADSVALLHLLLMRGCEVSVVHVNHALRGAESDADEAFVHSLCHQLGVPLKVYRLQPPEHPSEDWARRERYRCFRQVMAESDVQALVLAHHRDDQAETLLLHLMRGAGLNGLRGMTAHSEAQGMRILRPLLDFSRDELRGALEEMHQPWREDASNRDARYLRNAVRNELLPLMERLAPGCSGRLAETAGLLQADEETLTQTTEAFLAAHGQGNCLELAALQSQTEGLQKRILRLWWQQCAGQGRSERSLSREQTQELFALVEAKAGSKCNLPGNWHGYRGWTHLHLVSPQGPKEWNVQLQGEIPEGCTVRKRHTGDWLQTPSGRRSLQDFFTDRKVDAPFRDSIVLLCKGSEVLAASGVWNTNLTIRWRGVMPWAKQTTEKNDKGE